MDGDLASRGGPRSALVMRVCFAALVLGVLAVLPVSASAQETDPCPNGFHFDRMSGTGCVQDFDKFPEYGHPGYTGSPVCDLGAAVTEWREVKAEVPGQPGAGAFAFLCFCDTDVDRNPTPSDVARCSDLPQLLEDSRIERGVIEPVLVTTTAEPTTTTATTAAAATTTQAASSTSTTHAATAPTSEKGDEDTAEQKSPQSSRTTAAVALVAAVGVMAQGARSGVVRGKAGELVAKGDALPKEVQDKLQKRANDLRSKIRQRYEQALARLRSNRLVRRPGEIAERGERRFREAQARLDRRARRIKERIERRVTEIVDRVKHGRLVRRGREIFDRAVRGIGKLQANYQAAQELHTIVTDKRRLQQEIDRGVARAVHRRIVSSGVSPVLVIGLGGERAIGRSVNRLIHDPRREFRRVGRTLRNPRNVVKEIGRGVRRVGRAIDKSPPARVARFVFGREGLGRLFRRRRRRR